MQETCCISARTVLRWLETESRFLPLEKWRFFRKPCKAGFREWMVDSSGPVISSGGSWSYRRLTQSRRLLQSTNENLGRKGWHTGCLGMDVTAVLGKRWERAEAFKDPRGYTVLCRLNITLRHGSSYWCHKPRGKLLKHLKHPKSTFWNIFSN